VANEAIDFWQLLTTFDNFWQLLITFDDFWWLLTTFDDFWRLLTTVDDFWRLLTTVDDCWRLLTDFWWLLMTFDDCWWLLTFDNFWQLLTAFDSFWQLLTTFDDFWRLFCWEPKDWWRPLEAKSDFGPMFFGTGQVFWPDICPGQASRGQGCERRWTFLLRTKRLVEAIRGQIRFWANVFWNRPSILARYMPWSGL